MFRSDTSLRRLTTFGVCALPLLTFTLPSRWEAVTIASLDPLAMVKLVILLIVFFGGTALILARIGDRSSRAVLRPLVPFYLFFAWAVLSLLWTPRPAVSIGQAGGLASLLVLASLVALLTRGQDRIESMMRLLVRMLFVFSVFVLVVHLAFPDLSGLNRRLMMGGHSGIVHPTAAGANASLGLLACVLCLFVGRYTWSLRAAILGSLVHGAVLYVANSRMALLMAAVTVGLVLFVYAGNVVRAAAISIFALGLITVVLIDPSFASVLDPKSSTVQYLTRGQSARQLSQVSGREEMWTKVWQEFTKSKWIGHGYFITSETGELEVWSMKTNHPAHNIQLQILVSTGVIGMALFTAAMANLFFHLIRLTGGAPRQRAFAAALAVFALWYLGWSLLCTSFMGPVRSESVLFFALIGIGIGQLSRLPDRPRRQARRRPLPEFSLRQGQVL
ncbi:O-Antigen ligase [Stieleria maiorica]|uniref:O-Antigen ligase n=1 Tax=Stieleria maiorica TaxID=2795974 RepID=A0A5B9MC58_9BACT|nr:O-antigen ligase family protein [Stieleria maiorica]QEF98608.1 O-Antigen ligase [Stieleria maiorica]